MTGYATASSGSPSLQARGGAIAANDVTAVDPRGEPAVAPSAPAAAQPLAQVFEQGIPLRIFWRDILPAMLIVLATAAAASLGYVRLRQEVARRREIEARLAAARDLADSAALAKASFFATMSHEIRTPLSGIIGMLDLLKRTPMRGEQRQMLLAVDTSATALLQILDDVMDFSKAEANRMSLESIPVDLRALMRSVMLVIGEPARRRGVQTGHHVDGDVADEILGDPLRIRQILSNLVSNAAKFTHRGEVRATLEVLNAASGNQTLRFVVTDTGIGIARTQLDRIMAPFRQADAATARAYGGSGLGLSVSSRLAALMGGTLRLFSEEGQGTRAEFVCRFPVHQGAPAPAGADGGLPVAASSTRATGHTTPLQLIPPANAPRVLVVDDHAINRELMRRQLTALGYACDVKEDAQAALAALEQAPYALLLTDWQMEPMDGHALARTWRARERAGDLARELRLPVIAVTAWTERPEAVASGDIDAYLFKPVRLEDLRATLRRWLPPVAWTQALHEEPSATALEADRGSVTGLALDRLREQFGAESVVQEFVERSVEMLRVDLEQAKGQLCMAFCRDLAHWLHRVLGALSTLGDWPVVAEGTALERALAQGADTLPDVLPFLQAFEQTLNDIQRDLAAPAPGNSDCAAR